MCGSERGVGRRALLTAALALPVVACEASSGETGGFAIEGVRIFDGVRVVESGTVVVRGAEISAVGARVDVPAGLPVRDGRGHTLLPGLIDAHSHLPPSPDPPRFGVTTELEMGTLVDERGDVRGQRASTRPTNRADVWSAGTLITVPDGHGTEIFPGIATLGPDTDPAAFVDQRIAEQADYVKIVVERRHLDGTPRPTLSERQIRALVGAAHERGLRSLAHVTDTDDALLVLDAGISGLAHLCADRPVDGELIDRALAGGAFMTATVTFDKPTSATRYPRGDIYTDPRIVPFLSAHQLAILDAPFPPSPWLTEAWIEQGMANTRALHEAGVPILAGTDAPIPGLANGVSLLATVETLVEAGLSPTAALATATSTPADAFGLTDRGRVQPGRRADLVLVEGDPTTTITDLRAIRSVWKNGTLLDRRVR